MNSTKFGSKVKGFTLLELIIVMAIIAILAGISSTLIQGFQRDARLETGNNKAQMLHTGIQNLLIQCEIKQDRSLFDADALGDKPSNASYEADPMVYAELYFRIADGKIDDEIYLVSKYKTEATKRNYAERNSSNAKKKAWFDDLEKAILSVADASLEGFCAVYIDYEDYVVDSAICIEPAFSSNVDLTNISTSSNGIGELMNQINPYAYYTTNTGETNTDKEYRMLTSYDAQRTCVKQKGIYFGAYPTVMD